MVSKAFHPKTNKNASSQTQQVSKERKSIPLSTQQLED
jgi:hypothetical protein